MKLVKLLVILGIAGAIFSQTETYTAISVSGMFFDFPVDGLTWIEVEPYSPLSGVDSSYTGTFRVTILESNPNGSANFYDFFTDSLLGNDITVEVSGTSSVSLFVTDSESEFIVVYAADETGELKPSVPIGFSILPRGESASRISHSGLRRVPTDLTNFFLPLHIFPADDEGNPVPDYFGGVFALNVFEVRVIRESHEDMSAMVLSIFDDTPSREIWTSAIGGVGYIMVSDTEPETVWIEISDSAGALVPDTVQIEVVSEGGLAIFSTQLDGAVATAGAPATCLALSLGPDGEPDAGDDSTQVTLVIMDITGAESATFSPSTRSLTDGITAFTVTDSEPDSFGVFIKPQVISGSPLESPVWAPIIFLPPTYPTRLRYYGPSAMAVGDTLGFEIHLVNDFGERASHLVDLPYFARLETDTTLDIKVIDIFTGDTYSPGGLPFQFNSGDEFALTATEPGEIRVYFADAEERGIFDFGYLKATTEAELHILPVSPGEASRYRLYQSNPYGVYRVGDTVAIDIMAVDGTGAVDTAFSEDFFTVTLTGSAYVVSSTPIVQGRGVAYVSDDSREDVLMAVAGFAGPCEGIMLHFIDEVTTIGVPVVAPPDEEIIVGEEADLRVYVAAPERMLADYSGTLSVTVGEFDPYANGSPEYPHSIEVTGGIGSLTLSDTEAEKLDIFLSGEELVTSENFINVYAQIVADLPDTLGTDGTHPLSITAADIYGAPVENVSFPFELVCVEGNENGSVAVTGTPEFSGGVCSSLYISDSEEESVDIYLLPPPEALVTIPGGLYDASLGWYLGTVYFSATGVGEKPPVQLEITGAYPNPFNSSVQIKVTSPGNRKSTIEIFSITGAQILSFPVELRAGINSISIPFAQETPSGVYILRLRTGNRTLTQKIVLEK